MDAAIARVTSSRVNQPSLKTELVELRAVQSELEAKLQAERAASEAKLEALSKLISELERERDNLRASYEQLRQELELFKRRLFLAKAERAENAEQLELEYTEKMQQLDAMAGTLGMARGPARVTTPDEKPEKPARDGKPKGKRRDNRGTGRRDLRELALDESRVELADPHLEKLVAEGAVTRHGFEETYKLAHRRAGLVRVVVARVRYKSVDAEGDTDVITTPMPNEVLPGAMATASLAAHVITQNISKGMPLFRLEDSFAHQGVSIDRGTLSRWKRLVGEKLDATVVAAMRAHALATAFCISTDATGVSVQPIYSHEKGRQACQKSHFLVMIADREHILYEYLEKENGKAIHARFKGFSGYVQADAKAVFHLLFADEEELARKAPDVEHDGCARTEVGCWYHCRRRFWEAAVSKSALGREGLVRIGRIFQLDASWKDEPPAKIKALRAAHLRPHVDSFFEWVEEQRVEVDKQRGYARTALGYAHNQREALTRFFDDGRLVLSNNGAERAVKPIAVGRKAWLFCGSDDHAKSTAALFSIVASARLHGLDPEDYLRCLIRLVPLWPQDRMLELAPPFWARTRSRLDPAQLDAEAGYVTVPSEPLDTSATSEQQVAPS